MDLNTLKDDNCTRLGGGEGLMEYLLKLFNRVWHERTIPQEWKDALIVPIPKKSNLSSCDNWRGISLLDVAGKVFAKTLQKRLQTVAEDVLLHTQCVFRSSRGCIDMIYCARQLVGEDYQHPNCQALWHAGFT